MARSRPEREPNTASARARARSSSTASSPTVGAVSSIFLASPIESTDGFETGGQRQNLRIFCETVARLVNDFLGFRELLHSGKVSYQCQPSIGDLRRQLDGSAKLFFRFVSRRTIRF